MYEIKKVILYYNNSFNMYEIKKVYIYVFYLIKFYNTYLKLNYAFVKGNPYLELIN